MVIRIISWLVSLGKSPKYLGFVYGKFFCTWQGVGSNYSAALPWNREQGTGNRENKLPII